MSTRIENINSDLINWAITRAGNELDEFYLNNPSVAEWVAGTKKPTIKQLEDFTHKVHVPFGYMFLNQPPQEEIPIPFFRTGDSKREKVSLNVYHTIQIIKERQNWLTNYLQESEYPDLEFIGKYNVNSNYKEVVNDIRNTLNLTVNWASKLGTWEQALDYLTLQIEEIGIIVNFNGIVGNNTRRKIPVDECRGFVIVNNKSPFLFINSADAKAAQMFTLIHELAHIWLGESAGFDNKQMLPADDPIEKFCDKVAAEFLVPEIFFKEKWKSTQNIKHLSRVFKVSPIVIARRALDLKLLSKPSFFQFYNDYISEYLNKKDNQSSGGNFYATAKKRISLRFASYVNSAVKENTLLYRDAYRLTSLKGNTYEKFINEYLYQA
ncbi:ImmA/IrrE family metallo-endopeptidase [uncultured Maribacter sp.]|uniref:ImmA/IrrE family metallo-endopeptidase n=1 Tax=uncultured Maribacter sp. TaxID=431308 RepID=UPI002633AAC2|nr:ImmA/IrrE family metallo-endopeptidase [uncultured Maribacter sp.]